MADRPDLMAQISEIRAADNEVRAAKAEYRPQIVLSGSGAQQAIWPSADYGQLGAANEPAWSASLTVEWRIFRRGREKESAGHSWNRKGVKHRMNLADKH